MSRTVILIVLLLLAGIATLASTSSAHLEFRHYIHTDRQGIACLECHTEQPAGHYILPNHDHCASCHRKEIESPTIAQDTCGTCHQLKKGADPASLSITPIERPTPASTVFRHGPKLKDGCAICHWAMIEEIVSTGLIRTRPEVDRLQRISHRLPYTADCGNCHDPETINVGKKPQNHTQNWMKEHATVAPLFPCRICHTKSFCQDCHVNTY